MERDVVLILNGEEYHIGSVQSLLENRTTLLHKAVADVVETIVFDDQESSNYAVCSIEVV